MLWCLHSSLVHDLTHNICLQGHQTLSVFADFFLNLPRQHSRVIEIRIRGFLVGRANISVQWLGTVHQYYWRIAFFTLAFSITVFQSGSRIDILSGDKENADCKTNAKFQSP